MLQGTASFVDPHTLEVRRRAAQLPICAERIVIAVGTTPARPAGVDFDDRTVLDSDGILHLRRLPRTLTVIGGGVIGLEYASMAAALGVHVTLVEKRRGILDFVDDELVEALQYHLRGLGLVFRLGEEVESVRRPTARRGRRALVSGKELPADVVALRGRPPGRDRRARPRRRRARGRRARADRRRTTEYRTAQPHIFAAGDVIGFPSLAATSMEQGRLAALAAFGRPDRLARRPAPVRHLHDPGDLVRRRRASAS